MQTKSSISAAALAAALLVTPHLAVAQGLDLGGLGVDANVDLGGDSLLDVDADVNLGGASGLDVDADVDIGGTDADDSLVDVDLDTSSGTDTDASLIDLDVGGDGAKGPNGGTLIDLDILGGATAGDNDSSGRVSGDIRIGALAGDGERRRALLDLIASPDLADIDLDAAIDDTRVSIVAAADLLGPDGLADIDAALRTGGDGRAELRDALSASVELGAILDRQGIDADDVLAIQVGDSGATEVIVLGDTVRLAALGDDGDLADLTVAKRATADLDLLSGEELAELDVALLPTDPATANVRLLGDSGDLSDLSLEELASLDVNLLPAGDGGEGSDGGGGGTGGPDNGSTGGAGEGGSGSDNGSDNDGSTGGSNGGGTDSGSDDSGAGSIGTGGNATPIVGTLPATQVGARFGIAALDCDIGVLALAGGLDATPQAIASADSLELVSIEGCQRSLVDAEVATIRSAIAVNPVISSVLDDAEIPLDQVIGATIQGGTLTLFIEPVVI